MRCHKQSLPSLLEESHEPPLKPAMLCLAPRTPFPVPAVILIFPCASCTLIRSSKGCSESRQAQFRAYSSSHASCKAPCVFCSRGAAVGAAFPGRSSGGFSRGLLLAQRGTARGWGVRNTRDTCGMGCRQMRHLLIAWNPRVVWVGRDLKDHRGQGHFALLWLLPCDTLRESAPAPFPVSAGAQPQPRALSPLQGLCPPSPVTPPQCSDP